MKRPSCIKMDFKKSQVENFVIYILLIFLPLRTLARCKNKILLNLIQQFTLSFKGSEEETKSNTIPDASRGCVHPLIMSCIRPQTAEMKK